MRTNISKTKRRYWVLKSVIASLVLSSGLVAGSQPAAAQESVATPIPTHFKVYNIKTRMCLNNRNGVHTGTCFDDGGYTVWNVIFAHGYAVYENSATGLCLYEDGSGRVGTTGCNFSDRAQQWWQLSQGYKQNVWTLRMLDSNYNGDVYTLPRNDGDFQKWGLA